MAFRGLRYGTLRILDGVSSSDESEDIKGSEAATLPGEISSATEVEDEAKPPIILDDSSSGTGDEVEEHSIITIEDSCYEVECIEDEGLGTSMLTAEEEQGRMREEERWGHLERVTARAAAVEARVARVVHDVDCMSPEDRAMRREFFHMVVHGRSFRR